MDTHEMLAEGERIRREALAKLSAQLEKIRRNDPKFKHFHIENSLPLYPEERHAGYNYVNIWAQSIPIPGSIYLREVKIATWTLRDGWKFHDLSHQPRAAQSRQRRLIRLITKGK